MAYQDFAHCTSAETTSDFSRPNTLRDRQNERQTEDFLSSQHTLKDLLPVKGIQLISLILYECVSWEWAPSIVFTQACLDQFFSLSGSQLNKSLSSLSATATEEEMRQFRECFPYQ